MPGKRLHNDFGMRVLGRLFGSLLAIALFMFVTPLRMAYAAPTPPPYTTSWYMDTTNPSTLPTDAYTMGCTLGTHDLNTAGTQDDVVTLLFGQPAYVNNTYGTYDWTARGSGQIFVSTTQIAATVEQFGRGYYACTGSDLTSKLFLAAGVNNQGSNETYNHGSAWASMTTSINSWISANNYSSQVIVRAAADMEPNFNTPAATIAWVNGYTASYGSGLWLYNVGSADGCPFSGNPVANSPCNNGWVLDNVWYVSWGTIPLFPIPEIYNTVGANASQWYLISLYSSLYKGGALYFPGALTQSQACQQLGGCSGTNNTPAQGWTQLYNAIYADSRTIPSNPIRWSTDIKWK